MMVVNKMKVGLVLKEIIVRDEAERSVKDSEKMLRQQCF